jgi:hypothetical protein
VIQEPLNVGIEYLGVPLPMELQHPLHGPMTVACRPETVGVVVEDRLEERTQEEPQHLLSNAVADGGDTERPGFPVPLGNPDTVQGQGLESPALELPHQGQQILPKIVLEQTNADLVDPRRTAIPLDVAKGAEHQGLGNPSRQRMSFDLGHTQVLSC